MKFHISPLRPVLTGIVALVAWSTFGQTVSAPGGTGDTYPIDLPTALRLAGAQNLDVLIARERLQEAEAATEQARERFFPWLTPGVSYARHDGRLQDVVGNVFDARKQSLQIGVTLEARADLGDAYYATLVSRQLARAAAEAVEARRQDAVFAAAAGYFELARTEAAVRAAQEAGRIARDYAGEVQRAVQAGIAFQGDFYRAQTQVEKNQLLIHQTEEQRSVAAARLALILHLDPQTKLAPAGGELAPLQLVAADASVGSFVQHALAVRPELKQSGALVDVAEAQRQGVTRGALIPSLTASGSLSDFGGGRGSDWGNFGDAENYGIGLSWRVGPGGLFDHARERTATSRVRTSRLELDRQHDVVIREVVEAYAHAHSLASQLADSERTLRVAESAWNLTRQRREFGIGIVFEAVQAEQDFTRAQLDYLGIIAEHNRSQYALQRAIGGPSGPTEAGSPPPPILSPAPESKTK